MKKFEDVGNGGKGYITTMYQELEVMVTNLNINGFEHSIFDWFTVVFQGGNQQSERYQKKYKSDTTKCEVNPWGQSRAFILTNIDLLELTNEILLVNIPYNTLTL